LEFYVVKRVHFRDSMKAIKKPGVFWAAGNEAPLRSKRKESSIQKFKRGEVIPPESEVIYQ